MKNYTKTSNLRFLIIIAMGLATLIPGNAQTTTTSTTNVASKDTISVDKKELKAQATGVQESKPAADQEKIYTVIPNMPQFPGGEKELLSYIGRNMKYPVEAQQKGIQGRVLIRFVVNKSGKVEKAEVVRGLEPSMDQEGLRVINSLPDFIPGEMNGEKVSVYYTIPLSFKLNGPNTASQDHGKMPLFVLDGKVLPVDYDMNSITKDNIKSVNVLKADTESKKADLIAKYGERAANGVVELTSKK